MQEPKRKKQISKCARKLWLSIFAWLRKKCEKGEEEIWFLTDQQILKVQQKELDFIFIHAEKELKDTIDTAAITTTKATTLLTVTVALLAALIGYSVNRWDKIGEIDTFMVSSLMGCAYLFIIAFVLSLNIKPRIYYSLGSDPKVFFNDNLFRFEKEEMRVKMYYINEIESYRRRTNYNVEVNRERQLLYNFCYIALVLTPLVLMIAYLLCEV